MRFHSRGSMLAVLASVALVPGCVSSKEQELANVAKDWCATIRASQVMPVYPLTQDVQPGDVFLVQLPIDQQQRAWKEKGYLALDNHLARLDGLEFARFYAQSFPVADGKQLPLSHLQDTPPWEHAPRAAFPTYSFSVRKGGGLNLALPVSGVPIGLGLLGADAAEGSVSIGDARTLGIDMISVDAKLRAWSEMAENKPFLLGLASSGTRKNYVRVVTRVYLTGELDVSLRDTSERGAGLDGAVPSPVSLLVPQLAASAAETPKAALANYKTGIDELNTMLESRANSKGGEPLTPGGSLRLSAATARTISLKESFDPPLVLGYLGFDCEIGAGGILGPAVPTFALVSGALGGEAFLARGPLARPYLDQFFVSSYAIAKSAAATDVSAQRVVEQCDALSRFIPAAWTAFELAPDGLVETRHVLGERPTRDYGLFREWRSTVDGSAREISDALARLPFKWTRADGSVVEVVKGSTEAQQLALERESLLAQGTVEGSEAPHAAARHALSDWMFTNLYAHKGD